MTPRAPEKTDFAFYTQAQVFENLSKSDVKRHMRIGGPIGSECEDIAKEVVLQKGLNYEDFLGLRGFFNKNHSADTLDILGAPETVKLYEAGETMPDGTVAKHATTWVEGFLYDTQKGRETYELARAMQGSGRSLGFSIEGHVEERSGPGNRTISKARIQNVAITHVPCNPDARLEVLLRSVHHANRAGQSVRQSVQKTLSVGGGAAPLAEDGHEVPLDEARPRGARRPTALPLTTEELDRRILAVTAPLIARVRMGKAGRERPGVAVLEKTARLARSRAQALAREVATGAHLRKAALIAARETAALATEGGAALGLSSRATHTPSPAARNARKSPSRAQLLQSIFKAMPGVSVSYAQALAETLRRDRARSF